MNFDLTTVLASQFWLDLEDEQKIASRVEEAVVGREDLFTVARQTKLSRDAALTALVKLADIWQDCQREALTEADGQTDAEIERQAREWFAPRHAYLMRTVLEKIDSYVCHVYAEWEKAGRPK